MSQILLVGDERKTLDLFAGMLRTEGYKAVGAQGLVEADGKALSAVFSLLILDISKSGSDGVAFATKFAGSNPAASVIVIYASGQENMTDGMPAVCARLLKPVRMDDLLASVQKALDFGEKAIEEMQSLRLEVETAHRFKDLVAESPEMRAVCDMVDRIAGTDVTVMISGEQGVGKTVIARTIHENSARREGPFVVVDCSATDDLEAMLFGKAGAGGAFEQARGGTIVLAQIDALAQGVQPRLGKTLREKKITWVGGEKGTDVRVISSARKRLDPLVQAGRFNDELFRLLKTIIIAVPPLRTRSQDMRPLVYRILRADAAATGHVPQIEPDALALLQGYPWPGNVRQLEEAVKHALGHMEGDRITANSFPDYLKPRK